MGTNKAREIKRKIEKENKVKKKWSKKQKKIDSKNGKK